MELNTPIDKKKNCRFFLFGYRKMDSFLKVFRIQLFSKVLYIGHVAMFYICDIYNTIYFAQFLYNILHKIYLDFM